MAAKKNPSTKFDTLCANCGERRGAHADNGMMTCPGAKPGYLAFKKPSDKRKRG